MRNSRAQEQVAAEFGRRVKACRLEANLTLRQLAAEVGLSAGYLSQVETGKSLPSLLNASIIAEVLRIPLGYLVAEELPPIVRKNRRRVLRMSMSSLDYELICPDLHRTMEGWVARLPSGHHSSPHALQHDTEELILVLEGVMEISLGNERHILEEGDSIYYRGLTPHRFCSIGDEDLQFVSVVTPPVLSRLCV